MSSAEEHVDTARVIQPKMKREEQQYRGEGVARSAMLQLLFNEKILNAKEYKAASARLSSPDDPFPNKVPDTDINQDLMAQLKSYDIERCQRCGDWKEVKDRDATGTICKVRYIVL